MTSDNHFSAASRSPEQGETSSLGVSDTLGPQPWRPLDPEDEGESKDLQFPRPGLAIVPFRPLYRPCLKGGPLCKRPEDLPF